MSDDYSSFHDDDDDGFEIWDEHRWEVFFQESDRRTDKYMKLMKKYMDHPDRDEIINREMGWSQIRDNEDSDEYSNELDAFLKEFEEDEKAESWKKDAGLETDPNPFREIENLPVYQTAYHFGIESYQLLKDKQVDFNKESVLRFIGSSRMPGAKIAGGHGMGFSPETLGGNIANCKRGLAEANKALEALQDMRKEELLDEATYLKLARDGKRMRDDLALYILELREQFNRGF